VNPAAGEGPADARRALSGGADAVFVVEVREQGELRVEVANETAHALFGLAPDAIVPDLDAVATPELVPLVACVRDAATRERATRAQLALRAPNGDRVVVDVQAELLAGTGGEPVRVLAVVRLADQEPPAIDGVAPVVGVFRTELGLGAVFVDDALLALLGLSHEQALGQGWLDALHPDDRGRVAEALARADAPDEARQLECRVVRGGTDERAARLRAVPVCGDDGRVTGYIGSLEDLTEERRDREANARLAELADVLGEWIAIADADMHLLYANPATRRGLGLLESDALPSLSFAGMIVPEFRALIARELADALAESSAWTGDLQFLARDGRIVDVEGTIVAHRDPDGVVEHYSMLGRDVSALRIAQRALRESEERFRLIADSSPSGIYFIAGGVVSYANRRLADILGEPVDRVVGRSFLEWVHPDDLERLVGAGSLIATQALASTVEIRARRPGGETRWLRVQGAPVIDDDEQVRGFVGSVVDITDERVAQRDLAMLGRAVESTRDLVSFHDREGKMFFANAASREFFGLGPDEPIPPMGPTDFSETSDAQRREIEQVLLQKGQWWGELVAVSPRTGRRMPVSIGVVVHLDERGEVEYLSALSRDLTEQKRSEAARRRSEAVLRSIVQSSPLSIFALDASGTVQMWNRAGEELFGWSADEAVGQALPFLGDRDRAAFDALIARVFAGETVKGHRARYDRRDGSPVEVDVALAPLQNPGGRVVTAVGVVADVSEQTRATQALVESEVWFRSLLQHASDMVLVLADDFTPKYVSATAREFTGLADADLGAIRVTDVVRAVDEDLGVLQAVFARLRAEPGVSERATFRVRRSDDTVRWVEIVATNLLDDPVVAGIVVNGRDVTEEFEAVTAVQASEERLRSLLSSVSDGITVLGADGTLVYSSPVADEMLGDMPEWTGDPENLLTAVGNEDLSRSLALWEQTRTTPGIAPPAEVRLHRSDGSWFDAEIVANNLLHEPAVQGIVMTIRDVTERNAHEHALRESEARLRESEARYRAVVDDQIELVCRYLPDTTITFVNRAFAQFYGRGPEELVGSRLIALYPPDMRDAEFERLAGFGAGREVQSYDDWERSAAGSDRRYRWTDRAFLDPQGRVIEFQSVGHDVTEEHRAAVLTTNQADILERIARGVPLDETLQAITRTVESHYTPLTCAVFLLDEAGTLRFGAGPRLPRDVVSELDGVDLEVDRAGSCGAAATRREPVYVADATTDPLWAPLRELARTHEIRAAWSTPILATDGRTVLGTVAAFSREVGKPEAEQRRLFSLVAQLASIAIERKDFEDRLAHESMHDPLTGLPNRLLFLDRLGLAIARGNRTRAGVAVLFLDLDRFKDVNDGLGHDAGDELLIAVAHRLESVLRPGDTVARFGGDEFTILCEDLSPSTAREHAIEIAQRMLISVARPFVVRMAETFVGVSIGIALTETGQETPDELLRDADAAMYHAKNAGRGRVEVFDDTMRARALARHATENALHRAIERGELRLFFQPVVSLTDARCIGAEALVRWQHPERGLVLPGEFIPLAEETGLIVPLGAWVLEQAALQAARWQLQQDGDFVVAINLSARQLAEPDLVERVADVIARTGVQPSNLCFEITETVLMADADAVMRIIDRVRGLGVRFAIDDFGTGYSSLGYLKRFAVDTVKIDRAFIDGLADDEGDRAIVSAVIGLAHALGLRVVAEGVESEAQLSALVALGCDEAQGYFFAPPQPADDLHGLVSRTRRWRPPGSPLMGR